MDYEPKHDGTLLVFHHVHNGRIVSHDLTYAPGKPEELNSEQSAFIARNDHTMLVSSGVLVLAGAVRGSYADYRNAKVVETPRYFCPACNPTNERKGYE